MVGKLPMMLFYSRHGEAENTSEPLLFSTPSSAAVSSSAPHTVTESMANRRYNYINTGYA